MQKIDGKFIEKTVEYIMGCHPDPQELVKLESLEKLEEELSYNFCPICLTFQCVTHMEPNIDSSWPLSTPKRPINFEGMEPSELLSSGNKKLAHLDRWAATAFDYQQSMKLLTDYRCETCVSSASSTRESTPTSIFGIQNIGLNRSKIGESVEFLTKLLGQDASPCFLALLVAPGECALVSQIKTGLSITKEKISD